MSTTTSTPAPATTPESGPPSKLADPTNAQPTGRRPAPQGAEEFGLTDKLEELVDRFGIEQLDKLFEVIDRKGTVRITGEAIELKGLTGTRTIPFKHLKSIELRTPLTVGGQVVPFWDKLVMLVPAARIGKVLKYAASAAPMLRGEPEDVEVDEIDRPTVARLRRLGPSIRLKGTPALVALVHPRMTQRLLEEAERHNIQVVAKR